MKPISDKRLKRLASGEEKLSGRSTFKAKSMAEVIAEQMRQKGLVVRVLGDSDRPEGKKPRKKRSPRLVAKDRAWDAFSKFIRLRDADAEGYVTCATCQSRKYWSEVDAGHWITRAKEATLFDERNVSGQCKGCNRFQGGKPLEHEQHITRKHGPDVPGQLKIKAVQRCKRTLHDYVFIEKTYTERVKWIEQHEPGKFRRAA